MVREFRLPDVGEGVAEGELLEWKVSVGDAVSEDQPVAEVETDKAVVDVPSPVNGTIQELHAEPGDIVPVGDLLVTFTVDGEGEESSGTESAGETAETADDEDAAGADADSGDGEADGRVFAPPHVKRQAREMDVDLAAISGTGPSGRVTEQDVRAAAGNGTTDSPAEHATADGTASATDDDTENATAGGQQGNGAGSASGDRSDTGGASGQSATAIQREAADRDRTLAAPATRRLAEELNVDIDAVPASEQREGEAFVRSEAVREYAQAQQEAQAADAAELSAGAGASEAAASGESVEGATAAGDRVQREPYRGIRKTIGEAMATSKFTAPHVSHHDRLDATGLVEAREKLKPHAEERGANLTYMPIVMKAVVAALKDHPVLNTALDEDNEEIVYNYEYNVGVAVATDAGLMVPVVENVDEKGLLEIADEVAELVGKARDRSLAREEMQGGTFTITNFGTIGGEYATPILNHPETAILGMGALEQRPMVEGGSLQDPGEIVARPVLPLSLSIDHRVIDGADAARFVNTLKEYLQDPTLLLLD